MPAKPRGLGDASRRAPAVEGFLQGGFVAGSGGMAPSPTASQGTWPRQALQPRTSVVPVLS